MNGVSVGKNGRCAAMLKPVAWWNSMGWVGFCCLSSSFWGGIIRKLVKQHLKYIEKMMQLQFILSDFKLQQQGVCFLKCPFDDMLGERSVQWCYVKSHREVRPQGSQVGLSWVGGWWKNGPENPILPSCPNHPILEVDMTIAMMLRLSNYRSLLFGLSWNSKIQFVPFLCSWRTSLKICWCFCWGIRDTGFRDF